jgi:hypothetical protein
MTSEREDAIEALSAELNHLNWNDEPVRAREVADRLERLLGEPTPDSVRDYVQSWILIAEARGEIAEAIRLAEADLVCARAELARGGYESYPNALRKDVEYIQDSLHLQAERYLKLYDGASARRCLQEIYRLAEEYNIGPDEDVRELFEALNP